MTSSPVLQSIATLDATVFAAIGAVVAVLAMGRSRRPLTRKRLMESALSTIVFALLGLRYLVLAAGVLLAPAAVLGAQPPHVAVAVAGLCALLGAFGIVSHRGTVAWRVAGAVVLAGATVSEAIALTLSASAPAVAYADLALASLLSGAALVLALFHWTHRTAAPNPLGGSSQPFDY